MEAEKQPEAVKEELTVALLDWLAELVKELVKQAL
jgi:hypothetical protein